MFEVCSLRKIFFLLRLLCSQIIVKGVVVVQKEYQLPHSVFTDQNKAIDFAGSLEL